jgi:dihydrofolate synthase/folylpolyglutamate synthase
VPLVRELSGKDTTLDRIKPIMAALDNPHEKLRIVHVAGTSGKTSTSYYIAALLGATGKKVGLTVSPHIDSITERVQLNGEPLTDAIFCEKLGQFLETIESAGLQASYFELMYAFAIWVFAQEQVDYAVIETGVGGLHDATNIAGREDKVCVITDIGFDHMRLLGNSLPEIAAQKIGIVHPRNHVFTYRQADEVMNVFEVWIAKQQASLHIIDQAEAGEGVAVDQDLPDYQQRNWLLANACFKYLALRDSLPHLASQVLQQTQHIQVPGRMDVREINGKTVVMDGAHNASKMTAFITSFQHKYPDVRPCVLLAFKNDKEYQEILESLSKFASKIIVTTFETSQDLPVISGDPQPIVDELLKLGSDAQAISDQHVALQALLEESGDIVVITGSFYLLSQLRKSKLLV